MTGASADWRRDQPVGKPDAAVSSFRRIKEE